MDFSKPQMIGSRERLAEPNKSSCNLIAAETLSRPCDSGGGMGTREHTHSYNMHFEKCCSGSITCEMDSEPLGANYSRCA